MPPVERHLAREYAGVFIMEVTKTFTYPDAGSIWAFKTTIHGNDTVLYYMCREGTQMILIGRPEYNLEGGFGMCTVSELFGCVGGQGGYLENKTFEPHSGKWSKYAENKRQFMEQAISEVVADRRVKMNKMEVDLRTAIKEQCDNIWGEAHVTSNSRSRT